MRKTNIICYAKVPNHLFQIAFITREFEFTHTPKLYVDRALYQPYKYEIHSFFKNWKIKEVNERKGFFTIVIGNILAIVSLPKFGVFTRVYAPAHNLPVPIIWYRGRSFRITLLEEGRYSYLQLKSNKLLHPARWRKLLPYFTSIENQCLDEVVVDPSKVSDDLYARKRRVHFSFVSLFSDDRLMAKLHDVGMIRKSFEGFDRCFIFGLFPDEKKLKEMLEKLAGAYPRILVKLHPRQVLSTELNVRYDLDKSLTPAEYILHVVDHLKVEVVGETTVAYKTN